jgi:hypothetical protein
MDISTVTGMLTFAATTGIITALLTQAFGIARDYFATSGKKKAAATYLALRVAATLEGFAYECASLIADNGNAQEPPDEPHPAWNPTLPTLAPYPEEAEGWHALDAALAGRALDLRNHIVGSQGFIFSTAEYAEDELGLVIDKHAAERGQEAWTLAVELRKKYGLPAFEPIWDFTDTMERARRAATSDLEAVRNEQARLIRAATDN